MAHHYVVTANKSTSVISCVTGNFTSQSDLNLIVAKNARLEIYVVKPEGLRLLKEVGLYANVAVMKCFREPSETKDLLFIVTTRLSVMILKCESDGETLEIITKAHGNVSEKIGRASETGIKAFVDPEARVIGLYMYVGWLKIIPLKKDKSELKAFNIVIEELCVLDINFLYGCQNPTVIFIHEDTNGRHIKTREISLADKDFVNMPWKQDNVDSNASVVIPVPKPLCGAIIIGLETILYHNGNTYVSVVSPIIKHSTLTCYVQVDSNGLRYFLGNMAGQLFMLFLEQEEQMDGSLAIKDLKVEFLGEISIPKCIAYLDNGVLFIGSQFGDSQLVKLNIEPDENGSFINTMEMFANLAPIVDMVVVDMAKQGHKQLVTCSGALKGGSLRIVQNCIEIQEHVSIDLSGIIGMWALKFAPTETFDDTLVLTFIGQTRIFTLNAEEFEEIEIPGFLSNQQSLYCGNVDFEQAIQVTTISARLITTDTRNLITVWCPPSEKTINVVSCNNCQVLCAVGSDLYYLQIFKNELVLKCHVTLEHEIACLDITPLEEGINKSELAVVGLWSKISVLILRLPNLEEINKEFFDGYYLPRSVLMTCIDGMDYLLCGLVDGSVYTFSLNKVSGFLTNKKKMVLGTKPTVLVKFKLLSTTNVFVCSDQPAVIYGENQKLFYSSVNLNHVNLLCSINAEAYHQSLILVTDEGITIGTIDEIRKFYIRTVPLGEQPLHIAYQDSSQTFGVLTMRLDVQHDTDLIPAHHNACLATSSTVNSPSSVIREVLDNANTDAEHSQEIEMHNLLVVDKRRFGVLHVHQFLEGEHTMSILSSKLGTDPNTYYFVGTAFVNPEEIEAKFGRVIAFHYQNGNFTQVSERLIEGACYSLAEFNGKLLATINDTVCLFEWTAQKKLTVECSINKHVMALYIKAKGDFILVGDLARSMSLLEYRNVEGTLEEVAKDYIPNSMTAIEIVDDNIFLGAEKCNNVFVCQGEDSMHGGGKQLREVGKFHLGDLVNVFKHRTLVMQHVHEENKTYRNVLFGTASGAIGMITTISYDSFKFLHELEEKLSHAIKSVGKIEHAFWRSFNTGLKIEPHERFIDGDLVARFLDLPRDKMQEVANGLFISDNSGTREATVDDIVNLIETLIRYHETV